MNLANAVRDVVPLYLAAFAASVILLLIVLRRERAAGQRAFAGSAIFYVVALLAADTMIRAVFFREDAYLNLGALRGGAALVGILGTSIVAAGGASATYLRRHSRGNIQDRDHSDVKDPA
jgi:hypothetical protein